MQTSLNSDLADEPYAARIASAVLASFMQQPPDMKSMLRQLTLLCTGKPKTVLTKMTHPELGVAAKEEFFSLAACNKWVAAHLPLPPENKLKLVSELKYAEPENVSPEERERRVEMLKDLARSISATTKARRINFDGKVKPDQKHDGDALMQALANLEHANERNTQ